ncbi:MAG: hypothetical protein K2M55_04215 [Muribaculaceae bacterium]|nr:hypothetical protein [Muribaculaceae bacterium]
MISLPPYPANDGPKWGGYTLDQIRMRRALVQARMEIQKFKMTADIDKYRSKTPLLGGGSSVLSRIAGVFTVAEYGYLAWKVLRMVAPMLRRRK